MYMQRLMIYTIHVFGLCEQRFKIIHQRGRCLRSATADTNGINRWVLGRSYDKNAPKASKRGKGRAVLLTRLTFSRGRLAKTCSIGVASVAFWLNNPPNAWTMQLSLLTSCFRLQISVHPYSRLGDQYFVWQYGVRVLPLLLSRRWGFHYRSKPV